MKGIDVDFGLGRRQRERADRVEQVCPAHRWADQESRRRLLREFTFACHADGTLELHRSVIARELGL